MLLVVLGDGGSVQIEAIGLPLDEDHADFVTEAQEDVSKALFKLHKRERKDVALVLETARLAARRAAQRWSGKKPQTRVVLAK